MGQEVTKTGREMVKNLLTAREPDFAKALQNNLDAGQFIRTALTMIQGESKLMECTPASIYTSLMQAAQLSLSPDGLLGQSYLVPYGGKAVLIVGYKGLRELALRTDKYTDVLARVVYSKDIFSLKYGTEEFLYHEPFEGDRGDLRAVYAIATTKDGSKIIEFMWGAEVVKHRNQYSKSWKKSDSMWQTAPERAWEKTVLRRLCGNRLQLSVKARQALGREEHMDAGLPIPKYDDQDVLDIESDDPSKDAPEPTKEAKKGIDGLEAAVNKKGATGQTNEPDKEKKLTETEELHIAIKGHLKTTRSIQEQCISIWGGGLADWKLENLSTGELKALFESL